MTEPVTTPDGRDPDGCTGAIIAILIDIVIIALIVFAWVLFR